MCSPKKAGEIDHKVVVVAMMMVMKPYLHLVLEATKSIFNSQPSANTVVDIFKAIKMALSDFEVKFILIFPLKITLYTVV